MTLFLLVFFIITTVSLSFIILTDMYNGNRRFNEDKTEWRKMLLENIKSLSELNKDLVYQIIKLQEINNRLKQEHERLNNKLNEINDKLNDI